MPRLHATCVAYSGHGLLLTGPSGCGKSDLALRLVERGALLLADDQVEIDESLTARCPTTIAGLIEVRYVGVCHVPSLSQIKLSAVLAPAAEAELERIPEPATYPLEGQLLPLLRLPYLHASTPIKVKLWLEQLANPAKLSGSGSDGR